MAFFSNCGNETLGSKKCGNFFRVAEDRLASQEECWSMKLTGWLVSYYFKKDENKFCSLTNIKCNYMFWLKLATIK